MFGSFKFCFMFSSIDDNIKISMNKMLGSFPLGNRWKKRLNSGAREDDLGQGVTEIHQQQRTWGN